MNTTQVKCFLTVAKMLSFTEAAKQLFMAQPALSKQIALIEQELDMQLFDRTRRYVRLTPQGEVLYEELRTISMLTEAAIIKARAVGKDQGGALSIGVTCDEIPCKDLPAAVFDFCNYFPGVKFDISVQTMRPLRDGLMSRVSDLVLAMDFEIEGLENLEKKVISDRRLDLVISKRHPLTKLNAVTFADLANEAFIGMEGEDLQRPNARLSDELVRVGYTPKSIIYAPNLATQRLWAAAGFGVALIDLQHSPWMKQSVQAIKLPMNTSNKFVAAWRKDNQNPYIKRFLKIFEEVLPADEEEE